jgi:hypothetical protein
MVVKYLDVTLREDATFAAVHADRRSSSTRSDNECRPHRALDLSPPRPPATIIDLEAQRRIQRRPILGGSSTSTNAPRRSSRGSRSPPHRNNEPRQACCGLAGRWLRGRLEDLASHAAWEMLTLLRCGRDSVWLEWCVRCARRRDPSSRCALAGSGCAARGWRSPRLGRGSRFPVAATVAAHRR